MYSVRRQISPHAARLRRATTDVERRLWAVLRNRQVDGFKFRFQASIGPFVADFLCIEKMLIVELDGGQHSEEADRSRSRFLEARGYRILRFWNNEVVENLEGVMTLIQAALGSERDEKKKTLTQPSPTKAGEG